MKSLIDKLDDLLSFRKLSGGQLALIGFALIAIIGMVALMFPCFNNYGVWTNPIDALFTSVSAVCVTGLVVVPTGVYWNLAGQIIIIILIQIGGLGFMVFMTLAFIAAGRRITIHDRLLLQSAVNSENLKGIVRFVKKILKYAFFIEFLGAILLSFTFIPEFGFWNGIYMSVWHSISMYCNAGFDLMASVGQSSFTAYVSNTWVTLVICALIIIGGLGFSVYVDILDYPKRKRLAVHTKAVLITTGILLILGTLVFLFFEYNNPATLGNLSFIGKLDAAFFQSTTPRTAGANTIDQAALTSPSVVMTDFLMLIGASPGSTGGGIKTTTIFVLIVTVWSVLMGKRDVNCMRRQITLDLIKRAVSIFVIAMLAISIGFFLMMAFEPEMSSKNILFELLSAYGTVGLSRGITPFLSVYSKSLLILFMFIGRVGPLTIAYVITDTEKRLRQNQGHYTLPPSNIVLG